MGCLRLLAASGAVALALLLCPESARGASLSAKDEPEDPEDSEGDGVDVEVATDQEEDEKAEDDTDADPSGKSATGSSVAATVDAQGVGKVEVAPDDKKREPEEDERAPNPVAMTEEEAALADGEDAADAAKNGMAALSQEGDAKTIDDSRRSADADKYCLILHGFCWMWASPCSGGCAANSGGEHGITDDDMQKATWCQDSVARLPTEREFVLVRRTLEDNREIFHSRCAAPVFNTEHQNCDLLDDFVFKEDGGFNELVLVCKLPGASKNQTTVPVSGETDKATLDKLASKNITVKKTDAEPVKEQPEGKLLNALGTWASERLASFKFIS